LKTKRLTPAGKAVIFFIVVGVILGGVYFLGGFDFLLKDKANTKELEKVVKDSKTEQTNEKVTSKTSSQEVINISLDEWVGWKSILDANGGLKTKPGSLIDQQGLKVNINIINDATQSSNALIKGNLDAAGYTINRYAFLYDKFKSNGLDVTMPFITNYSTGGDGIIAREGINQVEDLIGKTIGVPRYSEAQTLVWWLLIKSDLTEKQIKKIERNIVMFDTPDDAAKAFFGGQIDAAATWQPYLSQAKEMTNSHILFDTTASSNIILDGLVFREDYVNTNKEKVKKLIKAILKAQDQYKTKFKPIKDSMPLFATETNNSIKTMTQDATLATWSDNKELLNETAKTLFVDMSNIWKNLDLSAHPGEVNEAFNSSIIESLSGEFETVQNNSPTFTTQQRKQAKAKSNKKALLNKSISVRFESGSAEFSNKEQAYKSLSEFVKIAKVLNNTIVQVEGNTDSQGPADYNKELSLKRAKAISTYLRFQEIDPSRFVVIGNGEDNPIASNDTKQGRAKNRRTEVLFKTVK
jgi:outer membrane protein OmpA-like peptidoglycan-associated protein/ABC-type amino acid transport substrate-binding protein